MSFLTVILSTSHHHLAGRKMQFGRAAKENGCYPLLNQVAEVAIVGGWEECGRSSMRTPRSAENELCHNVVTRNIRPGTSAFLSFHGRMMERLCENRFAFLKELAVFGVWALIDIDSGPNEGNSQRVICGPKWVWFSRALGCDPPNWQVSISPLIERADSKYSKAAELSAA